MTRERNSCACFVVHVLQEYLLNQIQHWPHLALCGAILCLHLARCLFMQTFERLTHVFLLRITWILTIVAGLYLCIDVSIYIHLQAHHPLTRRLNLKAWQCFLLGRAVVDPSGKPHALQKHHQHVKIQTTSLTTSILLNPTTTPLLQPFHQQPQLWGLLSC